MGKGQYSSGPTRRHVVKSGAALAVDFDQLVGLSELVEDTHVLDAADLLDPPVDLLGLVF